MQQAPKPEVTVIVPTRDRPELLERLLAALSRQTVGADRFEVVVADDGTGEATAEIVERSGIARLVKTGGQRGQAPASNLALAQARADVFAFTDDDTVPAEDWVERGLESLSTTGADVCAGRVELIVGEPPTIAELVDIGRGYLDQEAIVAEGYGATANLWVRREAAYRVGGFREIFAGNSNRFARAASGADRDFVERMVRAGARLEYAHDAVVEHPARRSVRELARKEFRLAFGAVELGRYSVGSARGRPLVWRSPRRYVPWRHRPHQRRLAEKGYEVGPVTRVKLFLARYLCLQLAQLAGSFVGSRGSEPATPWSLDSEVPRGALG